jgi:hypothetical protein
MVVERILARVLCMSVQMHCNNNYVQGEREATVHCGSKESN